MKLKMMKWMRDLFPLNRSITGDGIRKTLMYFEKINPEFKRLKFKSGKKITLTENQIKKIQNN